MQVFVDMDGVLFDFTGSVARLFGMTPEELCSRWEGHGYSVHVPLGLESEDALWERINAVGVDFWANLQPYPWANELWSLAESLGPTVVLSSPSKSPDSVAGKTISLQRWKGKNFRRYIFAPRKLKVLLSAPGRLLIDDHMDNVTQFEYSGGGRAIIFPRIWNAAWLCASDPMEYVKEALKELK